MNGIRVTLLKSYLVKKKSELSIKYAGIPMTAVNVMNSQMIVAGLKTPYFFIKNTQTAKYAIAFIITNVCSII